MGNQLCAPWRKGYREDEHQWTPRKDSHLLRLWAEIFEVQENNGDICWGRVSDDVVPVNITCVQSQPTTVFQITAYNRHVEKIFDVRIIQPGTRITQASECFVHWKDCKCDHEWGLNFTTPADARCFRECCLGPSSHSCSRKAASSGSLRTTSPRRSSGGGGVVGGNSRKSASNPTSPVVQPRRAVSSPEELAVQDAIDAGFVVDGGDGRPLDADGGHYSTVSAIATAPRIHRQSQRCTPHVHSVFADGYGQHHACENLYSQVVRPVSMPSSQPRRDQQQQQPTYDSAPTSATTTTTTMYAPIAERAIPYEQYMSRDSDHIYSASRVTPRTAPAASRGAADDAATQEMRQFSREPAVISLSSTVDGDVKTAVGSRSSAGGDKTHSAGGAGDGPCITAGFDSNTLKRMLQTLPEVTTPVDLMQEFEEEFADVVGPSTASAATARDDVKPLPPPAMPLTDDDRPQPTVSATSTASDRPGDVSTVKSYADTNTSLSETTVAPASDVNKEIIDGENGNIELGKSEQTSSGTQLTDVALTNVTSSGDEEDAKTWNRRFSEDTREKTEIQVDEYIDSSVAATSNADKMSESESVANSEIETAVMEANIYFLPFESQATFASKCTAIRKTGWLWVQNWLFHKMVTVVNAPSPAWNRYWVCLKGTVLLFYLRQQTSLGGQNDRNPRHSLVVSGSLAHPFPEYTEREHVFALSTVFGDAFLMQADSQAEMESWIDAVHLSCAASYARHLGRDGTAKLLRAEIHKLENSIDLDVKMKKMASMQVYMPTDPASRQALDRQMITWDENLEKLHIEQYQLRCYLAALQGADLPSTKSVVSSMSKATRATLANLGAGVAVSAFHALVSARMPLTMTGTLSQSARSQGQGSMSTFKADSAFMLRPRSPRPFSAISSGGGVGEELETTDQASSGDKLVTVYLPDNQSIAAAINERTTVQDLLEFVCSCCHLNPSVYFIRFNLPSTSTGSTDSFRIPDKTAVVCSEEYQGIELCAKLLFQTELIRTRRDQEFGFTVEAKVTDSSFQSDELCVFVSDVAKGGPVAQKKGLQVGDELLVLNGLVISQLDMVYVEALLDELDAISLTVRSCRTVDRSCPMISSPPSEDLADTPSTQPMWMQPSDVSLFLPPAYSSLVSNGHVIQECEHGGVAELPKMLSDSQRICKVIVELIETERQYVRDINCLIEWYLEPLKEETFLSVEDIERLFGNIQEIVQFQKQFLHSLEQAVEHEAPAAADANDAARFKKTLLSLGSAFLYYAHHFKLYSSFCASHSKAQKLLISESNVALQEFLRSHNPNQQHSATLESFLIKPIQRILKYPLLLRQLTELTDPSSSEHAHLREALHGMEAVAEHINEMQKIYEEYGRTFDELAKQYRDIYPHSKVVDLNVGELQMYGTVNWLNAGDDLGKMKKGTELLTLLFIFKTGVVLMAQERIKGKRKPRPVSGRPNSQGTDSPEPARFKTIIPVDQLHVTTTASDAHECHGIWEMIQCTAGADARPEKIFQFASSQEARRDFIRTIHHTVREHAQRAPTETPAFVSPVDSSGGGGGSGQSAATTSSSFDVVTSTSTSTTFGVTRRPESLAGHPREPRYGGSGCRPGGAGGDRYSMDVDERRLHGGGETPRSRCLTLSDLNRSNLAEHQHLGSQSTLASDRGAGGARLLHTSHDPLHYSSQSAASAVIGPHHRADAPGSPIWKRRHGGRGPTQSPASNDEGGGSHSDGGGGDHSSSGAPSAGAKQRVTFRIPPSAYIETEDTDC